MKYDDLYDNKLTDVHEWEELDENEAPEDIIERLRGTIDRGDCMYCGGVDTMTYEGNVCFVCSKCGQSTHEDTYYLWWSGCDIDFID